MPPKGGRRWPSPKFGVGALMLAVGAVGVGMGVAARALERRAIERGRVVALKEADRHRGEALRCRQEMRSHFKEGVSQVDYHTGILSEISNVIVDPDVHPSKLLIIKNKLFLFLNGFAFIQFDFCFAATAAREAAFHERELSRYERLLREGRTADVSPPPEVMLEESRIRIMEQKCKDHHDSYFAHLRKKYPEYYRSRIPGSGDF